MMDQGIGSYLKLKRIIDIVISLLGIIFLSPVLLLIAFVIKITSSGPVIFRQERIGLNRQGFYILKFRTMIINAEKHGKQITVGHDPRITKVGKFLRKFKLDELPQLFNVFMGDMSLVGPRPEVRKYVEIYSAEQLKVLNIRPGITDYASIQFSNENEILAESNNPEAAYINEIMPKKLSLNLKYLQEISFKTDLKLLVLTLQKVFINKNQTKEESENMHVNEENTTDMGHNY